jgi:hypothetical protein
MIEIVSIHIPKTAGSSFFQLLKKVYGKKLVFKTNSMGAGIQEDIPADTKVIHGHIRTTELTKIISKEQSKLICWLREPVERVISNYYYDMFRIREGLTIPKNKHTRKLTLLQYSEMDENLNRASWFLEGTPLEDFFFIGIYENLKEDMNDLRQLLDWPAAIDLPHRKNISDFLGDNDCATQYKEIDNKMRLQIAELNSLDVDLYLKATKLREKNRK